MQELTVFNSPEFGEVRTVSIDGEVWMVGKDVATILGYKNPQEAIRNHVDEEDKGVRRILTPGGVQKVPVINESGLYALVLSSKMPKAKEFKHWVTSEVLPAIRQTGGYIPTTPEMSEAEILSRAIIISQRTIERLQVENSKLTVDNQIMAPKAKYFDELVDRNLLTSFRETAKQLNVKETVFVGFLLEHKYIYRDKKGKLMPYAQYAESGLLWRGAAEKSKTGGSNNAEWLSSGHDQVPGWRQALSLCTV